jgi:hypothetical protein
MHASRTEVVSDVGCLSQDVGERRMGSVPTGVFKKTPSEGDTSQADGISKMQTTGNALPKYECIRASFVYRGSTSICQCWDAMAHHQFCGSVRAWHGGYGLNDNIRSCILDCPVSRFGSHWLPYFYQ